MGVVASLELPMVGGRGGAAGKSLRPVAGMACTIVALHLAGWGVLVFSVVPQNLQINSTQVFGVGIGAAAYLLGMRHAFDVDHIAAIDCTTRKLMAEGLRPLSAGFWFSLGHSSVVFGMCALLAAGAQSLSGLVGEAASPLQEGLGFAGTAISGVFLTILAAVNIVYLIRAVTDAHSDRGGQPVDPLRGAPAGPTVHILRPVMHSITRAWQMYPVGLLFGLGLDTATEVTLLVVAGGAAVMALPWYALLILPTLFAAGMCLVDTVDGLFMNLAYGRAYSNNRRMVKYNIALTGLSAAVALGIGTVQLASLAHGDVSRGVAAAIAGVDLNGLGYAVVGLFMFAWLVAVCSSRLRAVPRAASVRPE